ncbi:unnamed protein product [Alopecurus aequalis]
MDDEDLLQEILLRLPPKPSSLPRASLVCNRWRSILSDPRFLSRFRKHHRTPPLLGFFAGRVHSTPVFTPILDSPDRIPAARFAMPQGHSHEHWRFMGCRHGLAVLLEESLGKTVVWDPLTGRQHHVDFPPGADEWNSCRHATVLCADTTDGHVHGDCFSSPFKLVLIWVVGYVRAFACVYESASGVWGGIVSAASTNTISHTRPSVLVGNVLFWLLHGGEILAFDLGRQILGMIEKPAEAHIIDYYGSIRLFRTEDSGLGLAISSEQLTIQLWERKLNRDGVVGWVLLQKITPLESLFPRRMPSDDMQVLLVGYDEDTNVIVLSARIAKFILQLESMQITKISEINGSFYMAFYPYTNFYTAGRGVGRELLDLAL